MVKLSLMILSAHFVVRLIIFFMINLILLLLMKLISRFVVLKAMSGLSWMLSQGLFFGYQVSDNRSVSPCILATRMAFRGIKKLSASFKFISDGYSAYPLASQQFALKKDAPLSFDITQVIGLTNDDEVSTSLKSLISIYP